MDSLALALLPSGRHVVYTRDVAPMHRRDLQAVRGTAILIGVAFHAGLISGGYVGFELFFVVSGFLITQQIVVARQSGTFSLSEFFVRRFRRLFPALAVMVMVTTIVSMAFSPLAQTGTTVRTGIGALFLHANYVTQTSNGDYFSPLAEANPLLHTWSLSLEEQFYVVFPVLLVLLLSWHMSRTWTAAVLVLLSAAVLAATQAVSWGWAPGVVPISLFQYYGPMGRAWVFLIGASLAVATTRVAWGRWLTPFAVCVILTCALTYNSATPYPSLWALPPTLATAALALARSSSLGEALGTRWLSWIGDWSYSWYLWHWPVIVLCRGLFGDTLLVSTTAACLSVPVALLSFQWIEKPFRRSPQPVRLGTSARFGLIACIVLVAVQAAAHGVTQHPTARALRDAHEPNLGDYACFSVSEGRRCLLAQGTGAPTYLVGDSTAFHFSDGLRQALVRTARPGSVVGEFNCGPGAVSYREHTHGLWNAFRAAWDDSCREKEAALRSMMSRVPPGVVFLAYGPLQIERPHDVLGQRGQVESTSAQKTSGFEGRLLEELAWLRDAGHEVILVSPLPSIDSFRPCTTLWMMLERCVHEEASGLELRQDSTAAAIMRVSERAQTPLAVPATSLCPAGKCRTFDRGRWVFYDSFHITRDASRGLTSFWQKWLRRTNR